MLTDNRVHLFFAQTAEGLCAYGVYDSPESASGGDFRLTRWVRPRGANVMRLSGIDSESGSCIQSGGFDNDSRAFTYSRQAWGTGNTDGWAWLINQATWTSFRVQAREATSDCTSGTVLYTGLNSMAAMSADGTDASLRLGQEAVQFTPVLPCQLIGWPSRQNVCAGGTATFGVRPGIISGTVSVVWKRNGVPVDLSSPRFAVAATPDGLGSTFTVSGVSATDADEYSCTVTSPCGTSSTSALVLGVSAGLPTSTRPAPTAAMICHATPVAFTVTAAGSGPFTYQWRRNGAPLVDVTGRLDGTDTASLSLPAPRDADAGDYDCVVSNACGSVLSGAVALTLNACAADLNCDNSLDPDDLSDFIACYFAIPPCLQADVNSDGTADPDDLSDYIAAYFNGCG